MLACQEDAPQPLAVAGEHGEGHEAVVQSRAAGACRPGGGASRPAGGTRHDPGGRRRGCAAGASSDRAGPPARPGRGGGDISRRRCGCSRARWGRDWRPHSTFLAKYWARVWWCTCCGHGPGQGQEADAGPVLQAERHLHVLEPVAGEVLVEAADLQEGGAGHGRVLGDEEAGRGRAGGQAPPRRGCPGSRRAGPSTTSGAVTTRPMVPPPRMGLQQRPDGPPAGPAAPRCRRPGRGSSGPGLPAHPGCAPAPAPRCGRG